jgi:DNA invertase Pin-like site-specific DNA recombinase
MLNKNKQTGFYNMAQNIGYTRVSTGDQNTDRQLDGIKIDKIFTEKKSGKNTTDRLELQNCINYCREGDTLHVHSIDRLARNLVDLQAIIELLNKKGVTVKFEKENLNFDSIGMNPMGTLMFQLLGAFSEFERSMIKERQREGIDKALSKGVKFGAKPKFTTNQIEEIKTQHNSGKKVAELAKEFNVSRQTVYTMLK